MTLKDLFDDEKHPQLGSGTDTLVDEFRRNERGDEKEETAIDATGDLGRDDSEEDEERNLPSERFLDRMIKIRGIPKPQPGDKSPGFLMDPEFAEQYILNSFNEKEQRTLWRRLMDVIHLAQGDGNEEMVRSKAMSLGFRVLSHRSRNDTPLEINERGAWIEQRHTTKSIVKTNQGNSGRSSGFLSRLFGK